MSLSERSGSAALLDAQAIRKSFGRTDALQGASMSVAAGEIVAITGPSGSGKSTLLLCAAGVLRPESGRVTYDGQLLDDLGEAERSRLRRRDFGLVLQFGQLVPELTAAQNVALPLLLDRHDKAASFAAARSWLERLDADELADARPGEMSGGESQRVAIARALVSGPRVIFADEPTGALDTVNGERVLQVLLDVARETAASLVLVTHDNRVAASADREIVLRDGCNEQRVDV
ncbi:macrolide ABC transporter ATP-binding protein [Aeromicrobium sp. Root344]|uniref:ABC transporter ATP-binding protein n=1 Tax=Aeromicrobium sp. Root344 TaxID=1736521 RepID=UPI0006FE0E81|nr:ABC transporter ATP-binding protein [Aeromicrobium sp. Root344]KQV74470.1 macrolide ABC transporter ATP-binding protein [Aeromicrobium sp. Root344]